MDVKPLEFTAGPEADASITLPDGWAWARVSEVGEVQLGRQRAPQHHNGPHMRPYLRVANVYEDRLNLSDVMEMNFAPREFETYRLKAGDILLNEGQSLELVGRPAMYRGEIPGACFQNRLVRFRSGDAVNPRFAMVVFRAYLHSGRFQKIARWTTNIAHLGAERFAALEFPLPPLAEQQRIVAEIEKQFSRLDVGVSALKRVQAELKRYRAAVLQAACEGRLVPTEAELARAEGREYETGDQLRCRIVSERNETKWRARPASLLASLPQPGTLPGGWACVSVGELLSEPMCNGISVKGSDTPPGVASLKLNAMSDTGFDFSAVKYLPIESDQVAAFAVREGDFFVSRGNGSIRLVGRGTLSQAPPFPLIFPDLMIRLKLTTTAAAARWLPAIWPSRMIRQQLESKAKTTAGIWKVSQPDIASVVVPLPPPLRRAVSDRRRS